MIDVFGSIDRSGSEVNDDREIKQDDACVVEELAHVEGRDDAGRVAGGQLHPHVEEPRAVHGLGPEPGTCTNRSTHAVS